MPPNGSVTVGPPSPSLSASWLSTRLGVDSVRLDAMARSRELLAVRLPGSRELHFPAWQFNGGASAIEAMPRIREAARRAGLDESRLCEVMEMRVGLGGRERLRDLARQGRTRHVLECIALAGPGRAA